MYVIFRDAPDRFLGRYCGYSAPGPVESPRGAVGIRIHLHTDQESVASGFKARYIFEVAKSVFGDCGNNASIEDSGVILSPNYPAKYDGPGKNLASSACNWYLNVRNGYKISIWFDVFFVEGDPAGKCSFGCFLEYKVVKKMLCQRGIFIDQSECSFGNFEILSL